MGVELPDHEEVGAPLSSDASPYTCRMSAKRLGGPLEADSGYFTPLASYLTTLYYNDRDMRTGRMRKVTPKQVSKLAITYWNSLLCHPDHSGHRYRCAGKGTGTRNHDQSWVKVNPFVVLLMHSCMWADHCKTLYLCIVSPDDGQECKVAEGKC